MTPHNTGRRNDSSTDLRTLDEHGGRTDVYRALDAVEGQGHDGGRGLEAPSGAAENDVAVDEEEDRDEQRAPLVADGGKVRAHDTALSRSWSNVDPRGDEEKDRDVTLVEYAERRATFLRQNYGLDDTLAETLAWRELGFSTSGVAQMTEKSEGTVSKYLDELRDEVGATHVDGSARDMGTYPVEDRNPTRPLPGATEGL